jgi:hypothetical protein
VKMLPVSSRAMKWPWIRKEPVGFLVYDHGILLTPKPVPGSKVRELEASSPGLEVFGVHPLVNPRHR